MNGPGEDLAPRILLDEMLQSREMTLAELSRRTGISTVNLGKLKNGRAKGVFWSTLLPVCDALGCRPGELIDYEPRPTVGE